MKKGNMEALEGEILPPVADAAADAGRGGDTVLAHMSLGEIVIPRAFTDDPDVMDMLKALFAQNGADIREFTVGDKANKINPETGYPEFGFFSRIFRSPIFRVLAPIALNLLAPGLGTAIGSSLLGAGAAGASTLGSALVGGGLGALTGGGLKGALTGALSGGIGANIGNIGSAANPGSGILGAVGRNIPGVYDLADGVSNIGSTISNLAGGGSGNALSSADNALLDNASNSAGFGSQGAQSLLSRAQNAAGVAGSAPAAISGGAGAGGGSTFDLGGSIASALGGVQQDAALKKIQKQQLSANQQQIDNLEGFDPSGITEDPGYQFNLEQGQRGVNAALGAQGNLFSGRALQAAADYNQNYADNAFKDYYNRWATKTGAKNQLIGSSGDIRANATMGRANNLAQSLSNVLRAPVGGYDPNSIRRMLGLQGA